MIEIEIDGKKCSAHDGTTIIEAADDADIYIPRFCYHKKLSIAANCRMCLVDVDGARKPLPACATPVTDGMKVKTASKEALKAQRQVIEFLLINHPLDCPICDQGGECELQDLSMGYGQDRSNYREPKRAVANDDLGPLIATEMTRCIHCTRCVRFGAEVAGLPELGVTMRGENSQIGTYVKHFMRSELSGNIIDLCPVGALTSKPFAFQARAWEMQAHPSIAPFDCMGSNIEIHTMHEDNAKTRKVMRVLPRLNNDINEQWISDRDRFSYQAWQDDKRVLQPKMKRDGKWYEVDWPTALHALQQRLLTLLNEHGGESFAALLSPNSTIEEGYLLQRLIRGVGGSYVEHRLQQDNPKLAFWPKEARMALHLSDVEELDACVMVGANLSRHQPVLAHRLRNVVEEGCELHSFEPFNYPYHVDLSYRHRVKNLDFSTPALAVLKAVCDLNDIRPPKEFADALGHIEADEQVTRCARALSAKDAKSAIMLGPDVINHPDWPTIHGIWDAIANAVKVPLSFITLGANSAGLTYAGCISDAANFSSDDKARAFFLLDVEPELDCANGRAMLEAVQQSSCVVSMSAYESDTILDYADFILPIASHPENEGTFVNAMGQWQESRPCSVAHGQSKPAWKILKVILNLLKVPDCDFASIAEVKNSCRGTIGIRQGQYMTDMPYIYQEPKAELMRYGAWRPHDISPALRRAPALQERQALKFIEGVGIHSETATSLGLESGDRVTLQQGEASILTQCYISDDIGEGSVYLPAGMKLTSGLDAAFVAVSLQKESKHA